MCNKTRFNIDNNIIFLSGALRSGTTMLRLMIDHHPDITFESEFEYVTPMITDEGYFPEINDYYDFLETNANFQMEDLIINKSLDFVHLCRDFLLQKQKVTGTKILGSTVHNYFSRLKYVWPNARYIRITRDGRDVARSFIPMGWAGNVYHGIDHWINSENEWESYKNVLDDDNWIEIKYEDLLDNPQAALTQICDFIGLDYDAKMLDYPKYTTYSAPDSSLSYQWKNKQSEMELRLIESKAANILIKRGYLLSGLKDIHVSPLLKFKLWIQDRIYRWRFRINRYGFILTISELVFRKLKMKNNLDKATKRINKIRLQYLK